MPSPTDTSTTSSARPSDLAFTLAVTLVALLPRLFVALAWAREPVWDGHYYHFGATRIAEGLGYSEDAILDGLTVWRPWCHYPVGYSALLGAVYKLFGSDLSVAPVTNALLGALLVTAVHRLARHYLSPVRARVAAGLCALHPGLIAYSAVLMTEPLASLLVTAAVWTFVRWRTAVVGVALGGLLIGLATLVRPPTLLAAPLLALAMPRPALKALSRSAAVTAIAVLTVLPWTLRNCAVMDGCAFVSTNGGWNLAIGALTETGRFRTLRAEDGCPVVTGQVQQDRCWARVGLDTIRSDPAAWLRRIPKKLSQTYDHESFAVEYLREADPAAWPEERRIAGRNLFTAFHQLLIVGGLLGMLALPRGSAGRPAWLVQLGALVAVAAFAIHAWLGDEHPFFWLVVALPLVALARLPGAPTLGPVGRWLAGWIFVTSLTHAVFFGDDRYHLVITPALCLLAAGALRRTGRSGKQSGELPAGLPPVAARSGP